MSESLRLQTLALIGQEFLAQALANGGSLNSAVANMLLSAAPTTGREKAATALTGRIRSDAGMLRQGAKNAAEGAAMAAMIKKSALSLGETLSEMQTLVQSVADGGDAAAAQTAYDSLASNLAATIGNTRYNGISLVDKSGWSGDERLSVTGDTATLDIQMGEGIAAFSLRDLSSLNDLANKDLATDDLQSLLNTLSGSIGTVNAMATGYEALAGSYMSDAKHLESQAALLTRTAARSIAGAGSTAGKDAAAEGERVRNILIDLLLRDQGKVINTSS